MLAEFAARMNCGGADVGTTASFMRQMMHSVTRPSYDNVIATQTFGDDTNEDVSISCSNQAMVQHHPAVCFTCTHISAFTEFT